MGPFDAAQKVLVYGLAVALGVSMLANVGLWLWHSHTQDKLEACQADKATLVGRVELQNGEVEKWKADADAAYEWGDSQRKKAAQVSKAAAPAADALQARIVASAGKTCQDALREIRSPALPASAP